MSATVQRTLIIINHLCGGNAKPPVVAKKNGKKGKGDQNEFNIFTWF
jgi:hypothetical protein